MGKLMVSGFDFPFVVNPLRCGSCIDPSEINGLSLIHSYEVRRANGPQFRSVTSRQVACMNFEAVGTKGFLKCHQTCEFM